MKLLQLNTWSCNLAPEIVKLLQREQPDIVCLQEVISTEQTGKVLQSMEEILAEVPYEHVYYSPLAQFRFMHGTACRGNAIFARYPLQDAGTFWTHGEFQSDFDYSMGWNSARGVAYATVQLPQARVQIVTTHGYHIKSHKHGDEHTLAACRQIAEYINTLDNPVVLAGDFNLVPDSDSIRVFDGQLRNLTREYGLTTTRNHLTAKTEACDYILTRDLDAHAFAALSDVVSDHAALMLEFDVPSATIN